MPASKNLHTSGHRPTATRSPRRRVHWIGENRKPERVSGAEINDKLEFGWQLDWQIARCQQRRPSVGASAPMKQRKASSGVHTIGSLRTLKLVLNQYGASGQPVKAAEQPAWEPRGGCGRIGSIRPSTDAEALPAHIKNETPKKAPGDSRQEWCLHCQIPHTENSSYLRNLAVPRGWGGCPRWDPQVPECWLDPPHPRG